MNTPAPRHAPEDPRPAAVAAWYEIARTSDPALLPDLLTDLLAEEIVFSSPAVHTPQVGVDKASAYLSAAVVALGPTLSYDRDWHRADSAVLEFHAELDGLQVQGVDILRWTRMTGSSSSR